MLPQLSDHHMASPSITSFFDTDHDHHPYHHLFSQQSSVSSSIPPPPFDDYSPESTFAKSMCSSTPSMKHGNIRPRRQHQRKQRKTVRWGSAYNYESTTNPDDFAIMWYNAKDLEGFQRDKKKVIRALKHVKGDVTSLEGTKYVVRGFENYQTVEFNRLLRNQRRAVLERVLQLQREERNQYQQQLLQRQFHHDSSSGLEQQSLHHQHHDVEEAIATAARQESAWARELAYRMGLKDQETVRLGWEEFFADVVMMDGQGSSGDLEPTTLFVSAQDLSSSSTSSRTNNNMVFDHHMYFDHHAPCMVDSTTPCVA